MSGFFFKGILKMNSHQFTEKMYELAFGDDAIRKGYSEEEVAERLEELVAQDGSFEPIHKVGNFYLEDDNKTVLLLCRVAVDLYALICINTGNRWTSPIESNTSTNVISKRKFKNLCEDRIVTLIPKEEAILRLSTALLGK